MHSDFLTEKDRARSGAVALMKKNRYENQKNVLIAHLESSAINVYSGTDMVPWQNISSLTRHLVKV